MVNYIRTDNAMMTWSSPYGDEGVILVKPRNIETPYRTMSAMVNLTPTIGPWTLNYTVGVQPQWLTINAPDAREASGFRETKFNGKPMWLAQLENTFTVKGGWQFELGATVLSKCYMQNIEITNVYCDVTAAVQKSLLKDGSLILRLEARDLAGMAYQNGDTDFGNHTITFVHGVCAPDDGIVEAVVFVQDHDNFRYAVHIGNKFTVIRAQTGSSAATVAAID